jgi:hypothetical protein
MVKQQELYSLLHHWTNSMEQSPAVKGIYNRLVCQGIARMFITVFIKARYWTPLWASWINFTPSYPLLLKSILIIPSQLWLGRPSDLFALGLQSKIRRPNFPRTCHMPYQSHPPWFLIYFDRSVVCLISVMSAKQRTGYMGKSSFIMRAPVWLRIRIARQVLLEVFHIEF